MTFRSRLVLAAAAAAAVAALLASAGSFLAARNAVVGTVDTALSAAVTGSINQHEIDPRLTLNDVVQVLLPGGHVGLRSGPYNLPVTAGVHRVAATGSGSYFTTVTVNGTQLRELVAPVPPGTVVNFPGTQELQINEPGAVLQLATGLTGVDDQLAKLGLVLGLVALAAVAIAVLLGWMVGRRAVVPLNELIASVEDVAATTDVSRRLPVEGTDELARLRLAFNQLLRALEASRDAQRQLVLDASHELRTPLTSLRTNLEVVRRVDELPEEDRQVLVDDVLAQMEELTHLVTDLAELARGEHHPGEPETLRLDRLVADLADLAAGHGRPRGVQVTADLSESWVVGRRDRLSRAVGNLLDNAIKWSPDGGLVEVVSADGWVSVRDHGPGVPPGDLPHIFDRFYRAPSARGLPGSGLGLAIVAQVAAAEGGTVSADNAPDGGALFRLAFPAVTPPDLGPLARGSERVGGAPALRTPG